MLLAKLFESGPVLLAKILDPENTRNELGISNVTVITEGGDFTISKATHNDKIVHVTAAANITVDTTEEGVNCRIVSKTTDPLVFIEGTATIASENSKKRITVQNTGADLYFDTASTTTLIGQIVT